MVVTRHSTKTHADEPQRPTGKGKENEPPAGTPPQQRNSTPKSSTGKKRRYLADKDGSPDFVAKKKKSSNNGATSANATSSRVKPDTDDASQHLTVANKTRSSNGDLISKAFIKPTGHDLTPCGCRDPAEGMETYNASTKPTKPPLRTEDLQYDYDRTQLHDPARNTRPRKPPLLRENRRHPRCTPRKIASHTLGM